MSKFEEVVGQFKLALVRLEESLAQPKNEFLRDSSIQRSVQIYLKDIHGIDCNSPKQCFREAFHVDLIEYNDFWIDLVDKRNETVHTYRQEIAERVYSVLPKAVTFFRKLLTSLTS